MNFIIPLILVGLGLFLIFYLRPKTQNNVTEIKYMQTKTISELNDMFKQMDSNSLGNDYREYVELKGTIVSKDVVNTPFSNKNVAYCESSLYQVTEVTEQYKDNNGNYRTRTNKRETEISSEKSSQEILLTDGSTNEPISIEVNASGCKFDIPKTFDRFEPKNNLNNYRFFNTFSWNRFGAETLGFKMVEKTIELNQNLYVIGEAFRVGNTLHIGKPMDNKKPFIVTTKSENDLINNANSTSKFYLIGGIIAIAIGVILLIKNL